MGNVAGGEAASGKVPGVGSATGGMSATERLGALLKNESLDAAKRSLGDFTALYTKHVALTIAAEAKHEKEGGRVVPYTLALPQPSTSGFVMMGTLQKMGEVRKNWKQRFFVATEENENFVIHYYENQESYNARPDRRIGTIELPWYLITRESANDLPGSPGTAFMAAPFSSHDGRRVWHLRAESADLATAWIQVFENAARRAKAPLRSDPVYRIAFDHALTEYRAKHKLSAYHYIAQNEVQELVASIVEEVAKPTTTNAVAGVAAAQIGVGRAASMLTSAISTIASPAWSALSATLDAGRPMLAETARENIVEVVQKQAELRQRVLEALRPSISGDALAALLNPALSATAVKALYQVQLQMYATTLQIIVEKLREIAHATNATGKETPLAKIPSFISSSPTKASAPAPQPSTPPSAPADAATSGDAAGAAAADPMSALRTACAALDRDVCLAGDCLKDVLAILVHVGTGTTPAEAVLHKSLAGVLALFPTLALAPKQLPGVTTALMIRMLDQGVRSFARSIIATFLADLTSFQDATGVLNLVTAKAVYDTKVHAADLIHRLVEVQALPGILAAHLASFITTATPARKAVVVQDKLMAFIDLDATVLGIVISTIKDAVTEHVTGWHALEATFLERLTGGVTLQVIPHTMLQLQKTKLPTTVDAALAAAKGLAAGLDLGDPDDIATEAAVVAEVATVAGRGWRCC